MHTINVSLAGTAADFDAALDLVRAISAVVPPGFSIASFNAYDIGDDRGQAIGGSLNANSTICGSLNAASANRVSQPDAVAPIEPVVEQTRKLRSDAGKKRSEAPVADPKSEQPSAAPSTPAGDAGSTTLQTETAASPKPSESGKEAAVAEVTHDSARTLAASKMKALASNREAIQAAIKATGVEALGKIPADKLAAFVAVVSALPEAA